MIDSRPKHKLISHYGELAVSRAFRSSKEGQVTRQRILTAISKLDAGDIEKGILDLHFLLGTLADPFE